MKVTSSGSRGPGAVLAEVVVVIDMGVFLVRSGMVMGPPARQSGVGLPVETGTEGEVASGVGGLGVDTGGACDSQAASASIWTPDRPMSGQ